MLVPPKFMELVEGYRKHVRPLCFDATVEEKTRDAPDMPLFVAPATGARLTKMSSYTSTFFKRVIDRHLTVTRIRQVCLCVYPHP